MRYCVLKDTVTVIDGSSNTDDVMLLNADRLGYSSEQVEILGELEYRQRLTQYPQPKSQLQILQETVDQLVLDSLGV